MGCGDRKLPHARAVGCDEGESVCQPLWDAVLPLSHCSTLPCHVSASSAHFVSSWRGMYQEFGGISRVGMGVFSLSLLPVDGWCQRKGCFSWDQADRNSGTLRLFIPVHLIVVFIKESQNGLSWKGL